MDSEKDRHQHVPCILSISMCFYPTLKSYYLVFMECVLQISCDRFLTRICDDILHVCVHAGWSALVSVGGVGRDLFTWLTVHLGVWLFYCYTASTVAHPSNMCQQVSHGSQRRYVSTQEEFQEALTSPEVGCILLLNSIRLDDSSSAPEVSAALPTMRASASAHCMVGQGSVARLNGSNHWRGDSSWLWDVVRCLWQNKGMHEARVSPWNEFGSVPSLHYVSWPAKWPWVLTVHETHKNESHLFYLFSTGPCPSMSDLLLRPSITGHEVATTSLHVLNM